MPNKAVWLVVIFAALQIAGGRVEAHHAFSAEFDSTNRVEIIGTVAEMRWTNPHAWLYVDVEEEGAVERWGFEFGAPNALIQRGWTKATVPPGMALTIVGYRAKDGRKIAWAQTVTLPDGSQLFAGSQGVGAPEESE